MPDFNPITVTPRLESGTLSPIWLKVARITRNLRAYEVARRLGIATSRLSRMENGRDPISEKMEAELRKVYGGGS